jgi:hypothetical protein
MNNEDQQLIAVIADFLEMGHVENIMAMFKQDQALYRLTGEILRDERFMVRMGVAVLFEELAVIRPGEVRLAVPALAPLLADQVPWVRGEAVNILGIIGGGQARRLIEQMLEDPDPQVREIAADFLNSGVKSEA